MVRMLDTNYASECNDVMLVPHSNLRPGPWQPRRVFDDEPLTELARSIAAIGVLTPLRVVADEVSGDFLIVSGERRWRAAAFAGVTHLPCLVMQSEAAEPNLR